MTPQSKSDFYNSILDDFVCRFWKEFQAFLAAHYVYGPDDAKSLAWDVIKHLRKEDQNGHI